MSTALRLKTINAIDFIGKSFYINQDNVELTYLHDSKIKKMKTTDVSLFSVLTYLSKGKQICSGPYGSGKTTTIEAVASIFESFPLEMVSEALLRCNPQLTEEKMLGRPDLGALNKGIEKVIWSYFSLFPLNLIDEFNRMGEDKQILLLDAIDRGNFKYLNEMIKKNGATYATTNGVDGGNIELLPSTEDRFSIEVEFVPAIGFINYINGAKKIISDENLSEKMREKIKKNNSLEEVLELQKEFQSKRKELVFSLEEKEDVFREIDEIGISEGARNYINYVHCEAGFDSQNGYKGQPKNDSRNHDLPYLMNSLKNKSGLSPRWLKAITSYSKSLAWLKGEKEVSPETIKAVLPYTLLHKLKPEINLERGVLETNKTSNAKKICSQIHGRFMKDMVHFENFAGLMKNDSLALGKKLEKINEWNESHHPMFAFYKAYKLKEMTGDYGKA